MGAAKQSGGNAATAETNGQPQFRQEHEDRDARFAETKGVQKNA